MRNVMVRCIFSALSVGICIVGVLGQEIHRYQWSDQQVLADEWKPFVPGFPPRQLEPFPPPQRPDSSRQFFGKVPEQVQVVPVQQNLYKKSFQTAASANTIEPFAVPPILGTFNTFGLQTIQARNPLLDKNIKDNQFLDQGSHLHPKYFPQNPQQPQRFPTAFLPPQPQYLQNQQQHYPAPYRLENPPKPQNLIQAPSKAIQTTVQIFPPNPPNSHYQANNYFLGVPQKQESFEDEEVRKQQPLQRPNDFLLNTNNIATIYGTRDPNLNIPPPSLKQTPFLRNEQIQDHFLYDGGLKPAPQRYEPLNGFNKRPYEQQPIKHHELKKPHEDNPSKQVFEQLSQFSRPFSLPREPAREPVAEQRPKPDQNIDDLSQQNYEIPVEHFKKEKPKPSHLPHKPAFDRIPPSNYPEVSTTTNLLDYEPGKLQSIKSVTYLPQRDVIQFNEGDVAGGIKQYQSNDKFNSFTRTPFLPTPTESEEDHSFGTFQRLTTPPQKLTSSLPKNHKYFSIQHNSNRNRYPPPANYNPESPKYFTSTESEQIVYEDKQKHTPTTTQKTVGEFENEQYETTTRKAGGRRRKPSKGSKNKDQVRYKTTLTDASPTSAINNENYFPANDISTTEATIQYTTKKKSTKHTTAKPEDDYPNYPQFVKQQDNYPNYPSKQENYPNYPSKQENYPNYPSKQENYPNYPSKQENYPSKQDNYPNYPKEYLQSGLLQNSYDSSNSGGDYFSSEKEIEKENYPQTITSQSTTTTTTVEPTTTSSKNRINKNKLTNSTRPRFSIKDYKRTTAASTPSTPTSTTEGLDDAVDTEKKPVRKFAFASRSKNKTEQVKPGEESTSETIRKYKPRTRPPSKYRTTTTTPVPDTTTERVNTFKPSTSNRLKTSTSKYYSRFRTTTEITGNDAEEPSAASSDKKPVRTMLFSAKRSSILKTKSTTPKIEESEDENVDDSDDLPAPIVKKASNVKPNTKLDKADDASLTNIMTSSEEQQEKKEIAEAAQKTSEADKEIDITTSSEEEADDISSEVSDPKENEVTTPSSLSIVADDRMDDADRVSKVSSLTSLDESDIPISFFQKWSTNGNQKQ